MDELWIKQLVAFELMDPQITYSCINWQVILGSQSSHL